MKIVYDSDSQAKAISKFGGVKASDERVKEEYHRFKTLC